MSLLELRGRLRAIKSLNSIFFAQQVITTARMQKIKERYAAAEGYLRPAVEVLSGRLKKVAPAKKVLVIITSNRGLCGAFNTQVVSKAAEFVREKPGLLLVFIGRRGLDFLRRNPGYRDSVLFSETEIVERLDFGKTARVLRRILETPAEIYVVYNAYRSTMVQVPTIYKLYPVPEELATREEPADYILEPSPEKLIEALFNHYLEARFFQLILNSQMGELAARLMVLKGAVDNSRDIIDELLISVNKVRQTNITREVAEIVGSVEALRERR